MKVKSIQLSTALIVVLASLLISVPIYAQVKTTVTKAPIQIKKKEISKTEIKQASAYKEPGRQLIKLPVVGDFVQGGIVFWVDDTGKKGLVCAKSDQSSEVWWLGVFGFTDATNDGPFTGKENTAKIVEFREAHSTLSHPYAAGICNELQIEEGGKTYSDWYLPSKEELNLMFQARGIIDSVAIANGGVAFPDEGGRYWSSTKEASGSPWEQRFNFNGKQNTFGITNKIRVRAIRAFQFYSEYTY